MMDFDEFKEKVKDNIKSYLPMQYEKANVSLQSVVKNNDVQLTGLMIRLEENNIAPFIYLDHYYEQYQNGMELPDIMKDIAELRVSSEQSVKLDISRITDFNQVKDNIICKLINGDMNEEYLADKPYTQIHEVIILPMDDNVDKDELEGIIREVNTGQVAPEERLSYHAYQYDSGKHALMRMDKKEELAIQQQQDNQQNNHMHTRRSR